ncbi:MAG: hypothetical protein NT150_09550 [Bacteroidetes bacterium]|nr:hypothetical protein [Bacteroidota bacterium]
MKMQSIFFSAVLLMSFAACTSGPSKDLEEDVSTISFQMAPADCDCEGWVRVKTDPTQVSCEDECYQLLAANDSVKLALDELPGVCIDFTGNFYVEKQPFGEDGEPVKTFVYSSYKIISSVKTSDKPEESVSSVIPFERIDTNNFFRSFVAYVQNGNIYDMLFFYDSAYVARHCIAALDNDTARCMNEQYCGEVLKGIEKSEKRACIDFTEIEKIEFLRKESDGEDRLAYFKISSFDGRVIEAAWKYTVAVKGKKTVFGFVGEE